MSQPLHSIALSLREKEISQRSAETKSAYEMRFADEDREAEIISAYDTGLDAEDMEAIGFNADIIEEVLKRREKKTSSDPKPAKAALPYSDPEAREAFYQDAANAFETEHEMLEVLNNLELDENTINQALLRRGTIRGSEGDSKRQSEGENKRQAEVSISAQAELLSKPMPEPEQKQRIETETVSLTFSIAVPKSLIRFFKDPVQINFDFGNKITARHSVPLEHFKSNRAPLTFAFVPSTDRFSEVRNEGSTSSLQKGPT